MKRFALFLFIASIAFLSSCRKDHDCECTEYYNGVAGSPTVTTFKKSTRAEARAACHSYKETLTTGGVRTMDCRFKPSVF